MSSDYAQIGDVTPVRENSARTKIYEEIGEISSGERNIFGVKLRSSFQRANALPNKSQVLEESDVSKQSPSISSFKPAGSFPAQRQISSEKKKAPTRQEPPAKIQPENKATTKPADPIYAKPNKPSKAETLSPTESEKASVNVKNTVDKFKKPPPSFSPPPPPVNVKKRDDTSQKAKYSPYALPFDALKTTDKETKAKTMMPESEYAQIDDEILKNIKKENGTETSSKEGSDDEHAYYIADPVSKSEGETGNAVNENEVEAAAIQGADKKVTQASNSNDNTKEEKQAKTCTEGSYDDIDVSQVVRRKRGSHVTTSFSEESLDAADVSARTAVMSRERESAAERRANFRSKVEDDIAEDTYENNEVFAKESENDTQFIQESYQESSYGKALESVIGSMMNCVQDDIISNGCYNNDKAFASLKDYLMKNSSGGFDLESYKPSCSDSVERLHTLLSG